jgi:DNA-binding protein H-NS
MARTLAEIQEHIAKLQRQAEVVKAKEAAGVIERIREAIEHYGLTAADLFGSSANKTAPAKAQRANGKGSAKRRRAGVIRYQDGAGNTWTGHGKRPNWFKAALDHGKTLEDLSVKG